MAADPEIYKLKADIDVLRKDVDKTNVLIDRLDIAIEKMSEVSSNINKLLAVHDTKIESQHMMINEVFEAVEKRRDESEARSAILHKRITDLRDEMKDDQDRHNKEILQEIAKLNKNVTESLNHIEKRITALENWRWLVIGGSIVIGFIISKIEWFLP